MFDYPHALKSRGTRTLIYWLDLALVLLLDQASKAAIRHWLAVGDGAPLIPGVMRLLHVENTGAAFSLGQGGGALFVVIACVVLIVTCVMVWQKELPTSLVIALACVAGGGLGNMVDRVIYGSVMDFFATTFIDFPVFNVADVFVTVGVVVAVVLYWIWDTRQERKAK